MIWYVLAIVMTVLNLVVTAYTALTYRRLRELREDLETEEWITRIRQAKVDPPEWLPDGGSVTTWRLRD